MKPSERESLRGSAGRETAPGTTSGQSPRRILVRSSAAPGPWRKLAERELLRGLVQLGLRAEARLAGQGARSEAEDLVLSLRVEPSSFSGAEESSISARPGTAILAAGSERALLNAVFDFLERQGAFFGLDGESYPLEPAGTLMLPPPGRPWTAAPRFAVRGLLPWPDFLNGISVHNEEDFRAYFESMLRMRFNTFGMHVYTLGGQWAESFLPVEFAGVGHGAFLDTTATNRWGYLPQRTSRLSMGAAQLYDGEVFGSDAQRMARNTWEAAELAQRLLRDGLRFAARLGLRTGIGFEPYSIPDEIWQALPPEAQAKRGPDGAYHGPRFDPESVTARDMLESRLGQLLDAYPEIEYVWLWQGEGDSLASGRAGGELRATAFLVAHDFLRRHAPRKRLVFAGWGGTAAHFEAFHKLLPGDVIFCCLSDSVGWDPVHESFGKLEGRERWPVLWLEDDDSMWLPQLHVHRFQRDMDRAERLGCQGLLGIHWRHRIVDPTAGFLSRFSWDRTLSPAEYYRRYARTQAAGARAQRLASVLEEADRDRKLLCSFTGETKDGHAVVRQYAIDFHFWKDYEPPAPVTQIHRQVAGELRRIADAAQTDAERERLEYLAGFYEFPVPYAEAFRLARRLHLLLQACSEMKAAGRLEEARQEVRSNGVPIWLRLAPEVRRAMLGLQRIAATRSDFGQLALLHNKFVRLSLIRLRLSMKELLGELPGETEALLEQVTRQDPDAPDRLIVPTRPGLLTTNEKVRLLIVAPGTTRLQRVELRTRLRGFGRWTSTPARLLGRRTYEAWLGPFPMSAGLAEYYVSARTATGRMVSPAEAPRRSYMVTLAGGAGADFAR